MSMGRSSIKYRNGVAIPPKIVTSILRRLRADAIYATKAAACNDLKVFITNLTSMLYRQNIFICWLNLFVDLFLAPIYL